MSNIQRKDHIPKDRKFFDYLKEAWDIEELNEDNLGVEGLFRFQRLRVVYTHKDNAKIRFERIRNRTILDLDTAREPKSVMMYILDELHTEIQDEIIQYLTAKED